MENFKLLSELKQNHGGYDCGYEVDYEISSMYGGGFDNSFMPKEIPFQVDHEILELLFPDPKIGFLPSWKQGFYFDANLKYGLYQAQGGPCGVIAAV